MQPTARFRRLRRVSLAAVACGALGAVAASCQDRPICPGSPGTSAVVYGRLTQSSVDKVDLLLAVDNSRSMADKQALLALAVPDLIAGLVNPPCLDAAGQPVAPGPTGPLDACPDGSGRPFEPILDIHIGVITSSLGSHGADTCDPSAAGKASNDDQGHLVARLDPAAPEQAPTYQDMGFLAWDPAQKLAPPGEADLATDSGADPDATALVPVLRDMITGAGDIGCGFEAQLESWYRFLVDPTPSAQIVIDAGGEATPTGLDEALLAQRKAFLRPDSLLGIVLLTDENDCSVREGGWSYQLLRQKGDDGAPFHVPRARAVCESDPDNLCCYSCAQTGVHSDANGDPCPEDPTCKDAQGALARLDAADDPINLRCWDQKRRFGVDVLYPIERYRRGLTQPTVLDRDGNEVPNPIFADLDPDDANSGSRSASMVVLTGIAGVPWQDIARDPADLTKGLQSADELAAPGPSGLSAWDLILGDPDKGVAPADPLMLSSRSPRSGKSPVTGDALATSDTPLANPVNGHDYGPPDDLEYACIFDLPAPLDCADLKNCGDAPNSPVYDPPYNAPPDKQVRAGARPGTRILSLLRALGPQGVVGSACPAQTTDAGALDFGYRPAISAALRRLEAEIDGGCLSRRLDVDGTGQVACALIEARKKDADGGCCHPDEARVVPAGSRSAFVSALAEDTAVVERGLDCFCEIPQLSGDQPGDELYTCQNDASDAPLLPGGEPVNGYCYVDPTATPPAGNPELVASCPDTEKRTLRFVGKGQPAPGALVFVTCNATEDSGGEQCSSGE